MYMVLRTATERAFTRSAPDKAHDHPDVLRIARASVESVGVESFRDLSGRLGAAHLPRGAEKHTGAHDGKHTADGE
jgi:hypothetical protein